MRFAAAAEVETPNWRTTWGHRAAIASRVREAVREAVDGSEPPGVPCVVTIERVGPNRMDDDNVVAACKAVRDEVAAWLGVDDGDARVRWEYAQRIERMVDETPRARRKLRTWVEIEVRGADVGADADADANEAPMSPPARLERERARPDVRVEPAYAPMAAVRVGAAGLSVELVSSKDGEYVRICKHYVQQGHAWRTSGAAIRLDEVEGVIAALTELRARADRR